MQQVDWLRVDEASSHFMRPHGKPRGENARALVSLEVLAQMVYARQSTLCPTTMLSVLLHLPTWMATSGRSTPRATSSRGVEEAGRGEEPACSSRADPASVPSSTERRLLLPLLLLLPFGLVAALSEPAMRALAAMARVQRPGRAAPKAC